jgi:hydrogenase-4 component F
VVAAVFFIIRQRDVKRMFAYSSIEHMGLITFAFGMGGPVASLCRAAAHDGAFAHQVGYLLCRRPRHAKGRHADHGRDPRPDPVSPTVGWGLMLGALAILGMPPFGVFASEFLIVTTAMREQPWATPFLLIWRWGVAFASVLHRVQPMVFGDTTH